MVPEIALTPSVAALFRGAFGDRVAIQHSALSDGERHDQWQRIRRGDVDVVVGTRSAVFAPLARPGLVIVDEEHDSSYKQEEAPRYHGRDVAIVRGSAAGALVVLGSATPSMETYQQRRDRQVRAGDARAARARSSAGRGPPGQHARGVRGRGPGRRHQPALAAAIEDRLRAREQVLVLLNRRGYATAVFCRQCGDTFECPNCSVSLTVHTRVDARVARALSLLQLLDEVPKACRKCAAPYLEQPASAPRRSSSSCASVSRRAHRPRRSRFGAAEGRAGVAPVAVRGGRARRARRHADDCEGARLSRASRWSASFRRTSGSAWPTSAPPSGRFSC